MDLKLNTFFRQNFWLVPLPMLAVAAYYGATAVTQLVGVTVAVTDADLARPPAVTLRPKTSPASTNDRSAATILHRNPFDHVTGPLDVAPVSSAGAVLSEAPIDDDPWTAPACDGVHVRAIVASDDVTWAFAEIAGNDGKYHLFRRGGDVGGKAVHFIGWDRVWLTSGGRLCQASLFAPQPPPAPAPAASAPAPAPNAAPRRGAQPLAADLKKGIQAVSATEFNIDRGVVDKILENQADLMRQARIVPVQENGRTVGVRLNGIKADTLLGVLGMQNGDVLKTINGFDMGSPEKALEAYARLRTADKLTLSVNRGGKDFNLDYNIK